MTLIEALNARFTDISEVYDISNHGIDTGVNGFIYSTELAEFYDLHEDDILDVLGDLEITPNDLIKDEDYWTMQEMKEAAVWVVVEHYCHTRVDIHEEAAANALPAHVGWTHPLRTVSNQASA